MGIPDAQLTLKTVLSKMKNNLEFWSVLFKEGDEN